MKQRILPARVTDIGERDFWSSLRPVPNRPNRDLLLEAIRLGRAGRKAQAHSRLGAYYRLALADEWRLARDQARQQSKPSTATLLNLFRGKDIRRY